MFYAVVIGKVPGIYTDWTTTSSMVLGYPGAIYKSFPKKEDAENFIKNSTRSILPLFNTNIVYTDGSYSNNACGFGLVIITNDNKKITAYGRVPLSPSNNVAELYAIYVALSLVSTNVIIYSDSNYSIACLTTYIHNWVQNGWRNVSNRELIESCYKLMQNRAVSFQYTSAHSGVKYNEEADQLANKGRLITEQLIINK